MLEKIKTILASAFSSPLSREEQCVMPTGLEGVSLDSLLELVSEKGAFKGIEDKKNILLTADWSEMVSPLLLDNNPEASNFIAQLSEQIGGGKIIELGAGAKASEHQVIFIEKFGCSEYMPVDKQQVVKECVLGVCGDALRVLSVQPPNSANLVAFGLFNEPLMANHIDGPTSNTKDATPGHLEHEYLRRLAKEISRVIPDDGILFGAGLYALGSDNTFALYLEQNGFRKDRLLLKAYTDFQRQDQGRAFFFKSEAYENFKQASFSLKG